MQSNALDSLMTLAESVETPLSLEQFHDEVNRTFHRFEAEVYDEAHWDLWNDLPQQINSLVDDVLPKLDTQRVRVADVGCGTGLGSIMLMGSQLGSRIAEMHLVDTSAAMLDLALRRDWHVPVSTREGTIDQLPSGSFDLVLVSSVLHHIPDLRSFLRHVDRVLTPGGVFMHLQDRNSETLDDPVLRDRIAVVATSLNRQAKLRRLKPSRVLGKIKRTISGEKPETYFDRINKDLLARRIISRPMTADELWSITDIQLNFAGGISITEMRDHLPTFELVNARTYAFFGSLPSKLPRRFRPKEDALIRAGAMHGYQLSGVWVKTSTGTV